MSESKTDQNVCNICGDPITERELLTTDADGAPAHAWCVEDIEADDADRYGK